MLFTNTSISTLGCAGLPMVTAGKRWSPKVCKVLLPTETDLEEGLTVSHPKHHPYLVRKPAASTIQLIMCEFVMTLD